MSGLHVYPADTMLSKFVRARDLDTCQKCTRTGIPLDYSHFEPRANLRTRFYEDNAVTLCRDCHNHMARHRREHELFMEQRLGEKRFRELLRRINEPLRVKIDPAAEARRLRLVLKGMRRAENVIGRQI